MGIYFALMYFTFYEYINAQLHMEYKLRKSSGFARGLHLFAKINKAQSFKNVHVSLHNI